MPLDLSHIRQPAHTEAEELPAESTGYAFSDRSLAYTRRSNQADNLTLYSPTQLADGKEFQNTRLDVDKAIMVLVQNLFSVCDRIVLRRMATPWDLRH